MNATAIKNPSSIIKTLCISIALLHTGRFALGNVAGPDMQNFNATPDGLDFVTVQSSETLKPGFWNFGLFVNQATGTLPRFPRDGSNRPVGHYTDKLLGLDVNVAVGVTRRLTFGLSFPHVIHQTVRDSEGVRRGEFLKPGATELRPLAKYQFAGGADGGGAVVVSTGINMVEDNPYTGLGAPPILNLELAFDSSSGPWAGAINVGYRHRTPGDALTGAPVEPLGSQWIASLAGSRLIPGLRLRAVAEVFASAPASKNTNRSDRMLSSSEALVGLKYVATDVVALHAGAGREFIHGIASPDFRAYAGLNITLGPKHGHHTKTLIKRRTQLDVKQEEPMVRDFVAEESDDPIVNDPLPNLEGVPPKGEEIFVINNVFFAFDRFDLVVPGGRDILKRLAVYLYKTPEFRQLVIEGHTDFIGSETYNKDLSLRRAVQIRRYLVEVLHVDVARIQVIGYGESRPIADNGNFQGRQMNRRVEFKISR